ncbi:hypothetical protein HUJ04_013159 [Dendroctonus ponderosae]|nr:hypothetical protein HUJ04_013159 [Dendroctonus ponderosae]
MAKIEAAYNGRFPNAHIRSLLPHLTIDQIKYRRKKDDYKNLLETLCKGPQTMDLVEEINAETTICDVGTLDTAFIVEEELLTPAEVSLWARPTEVFTNGSLNADNTESVPVEDSFRNILTVLAQKTGLCEAFVFLARLSNLPQSTERGRKLLEQLGTCIKSLPGRSTGQKRPKKVPTKTGYDLASLNRYKKRALCFKETQTAFERNRAELAKCILEDLPLSREEERPEVEAVEREYRGIFQRPSLEDTEEYGTPISAINLDYPITIKEITDAQKSNKGKAAGPDFIRPSDLARICPQNKLPLITAVAGSFAREKDALPVRSDKLDCQLWCIDLVLCQWRPLPMPRIGKKGVR